MIDRGPAMINQWRSMMDNLSDVYYLVQLIVRQVFVYLQDLILYKFFWLANDDFNSTGSKLRGLAAKNITADILAFSIICTILFLLAMLASNCEKESGRLYASAGIETTVRQKLWRTIHRSVSITNYYTYRVSVDFQENPCFVTSASSSTSNCFHACGDSILPLGSIPKRNFSDESFSRIRSSNRERIRSILRRSIFGVSGGGVQIHNSQSTQTEKLVDKINQTWLIRRTRSGQIYGKYPG